jgi:queuine tRNA-ribosyltransferase
MQIQHQLGADVIFAFDELTTLMNTHEYQQASVARTQAWAERCVAEHRRLADEDPEKPAQALFGVVQGAQHEDLRRQAARDLVPLGFDGFGIGGAIEKENLDRIVGWVVDELPDDQPRHLLGIGEPEDLFMAVEQGCDLFDCVQPSRVGRTSRVYTARGRYNLDVAASRRRFTPIEDGCDCYTCGHYTVAYLHHLFKANEYLAATLATIHNERFIVRLVDDMRSAIESGDFAAMKTEFLGGYSVRAGSAQ